MTGPFSLWNVGIRLPGARSFQGLEVAFAFYAVDI